MQSSWHVLILTFFSIITVGGGALVVDDVITSSLFPSEMGYNYL